jgi:opacity protein-like surface antigen
MKRILMTAACLATLGSASFAASQNEVNTINRYLPDVNVHALDDTTIASLMNVANSSDNYSEAKSTMWSLVYAGNPVTQGIPEASFHQLEAFAPGINFHKMSKAELHHSVALMNSESRSDAIATMKSFELN